MSTCGNASNGSVKGTGSNSNCLEKKTQTAFLTTEDFEFDSIDEVRNKAKLEDGILAGNIIPVFELYKLDNDNSDRALFEEGNFSYETEKAVKRKKAENYLSVCNHRNVKSLEDSKFKRIIEITSDGDYLLVNIEGKYKGQSIKKFDVGMRLAPVGDNPPITPIRITYSDYEEFENNGEIVTPDYNPLLSIDGVYEINLELITIDGANEVVVVKATTNCGKTLVNGLEANGTFKAIKADGTTNNSTAVLDSDGVYRVSLASWENGKLSIDGVKHITSMFVKTSSIINIQI